MQGSQTPPGQPQHIQAALAKAASFGSYAAQVPTGGFIGALIDSQLPGEYDDLDMVPAEQMKRPRSDDPFQ